MCIVSSIGSFIYERYGQAGKDLVIPIYPLFVGFIKKYVSIMENHYNKNERCLNPRTPLQLCIYQARRSWGPNILSSNAMGPRIFDTDFLNNHILNKATSI